MRTDGDKDEECSPPLGVMDHAQEAGEEMDKMDACLQCGLCVEVCPVERSGASSFLARLMGESTPEAATWRCTSCWLCQAACPLNLDIHSLVIAARRESDAPPAYAGGYENVQRTGFTLPLPHDLNAVRAAYGLPPVELPAPETLAVLLGVSPEDKNGGG